MDKQHSIMDLFGGKQEEELVRTKVCIVQQGETIDGLAQRYDVTVQSMLFSNELEAQPERYRRASHLHTERHCLQELIRTESRAWLCSCFIGSPAFITFCKKRLVECFENRK